MIENVVKRTNNIQRGKRDRWKGVCFRILGLIPLLLSHPKDQQYPVIVQVFSYESVRHNQMLGEFIL